MSKNNEVSAKSDLATHSKDIGHNSTDSAESFEATDLGLLLKNQSSAGASELPPSSNANILRHLQSADGATLNRKVMSLQQTVGNKAVERLLTEHRIRRRFANNNVNANIESKEDSTIRTVTSDVNTSLQTSVVENLPAPIAADALATATGQAENKPITENQPVAEVTATSTTQAADGTKKVAANVPAAAQAQAGEVQAKNYLNNLQQVNPAVVEVAAKTAESKPVTTTQVAYAKTAPPTKAKTKANTPAKDPQLAKAAKGKPEDGVKLGDVKAPEGPITAPKEANDAAGLAETADIPAEEINLEKPFKVSGFEIQRSLAAFEPPKTKPPVAPEQDPAFLAVKQKTQAVAKQEKTHEPAKSKVDEANAASVPPTNEVSSQAGANQVGEMNKQEAGEFDKAAFVAAVRKAVEAVTPRDEDEADKFKDSGKAGEVKDKVSGMVGDSKDDAQKDIDKTTKQTPDTSKVNPKQVVPMQPEKPGDKPADVGAASGMPKPKSTAEISLDYGPNKLDKQMSDAKVTEEQLQKSNEPAFNGAVEDKKKAEEEAKTKPQQFRQTEKSLLEQGKNDAKAQANTALDGMHATRTSSLGEVTGDKDKTKSEDEQVRTKLAADLELIYTKTQNAVKDTLDGLDGKVNTEFEKGEKEARQDFENYVKDRMDKYKEQRYGGLFGWTNRVVDHFKGMPSEVNAFYTEGRNRYLTKMDELVSRIADIVGEELRKAKTQIADGLKESNETIAKVAKDKPEIAREAQEGMQEKFEQLKSDVDEKQNAVVDSLAQKYVESRNAVDDRIKAMQEENKGLIDKIVDTVKGVIDTILQLKDMLLNVLARAASAIDKILKDPIGFLSNLINALKQGLGQFVANIGTHLQNGLIGWLTGTLGAAGLKMPANFDLKGILDLVLQLTGLTYQNIRSRIVKATSEKFVSRLEKAAEIIMILISEGPMGLWNYIQEQAESLMNQVIEGIKEMVISKVIQAGINWMISLFNPAGAFIAAAKAIVAVVQFIMERGSQIMSFVNSVLDSVEAIASGSIGGAANAIEQSLAKALPLAISFLANLLGLSGISEKIKNIIGKVQKPVNNAIDKVINATLTKFKGVFKKEDAEKHKKVVEKVAAELGKADSKPRPYKVVEKERKAQATQLETQYATQVEKPNKIDIKFGNTSAGAEAGKLEFTVNIGPEAKASKKGSIKTLTKVQAEKGKKGGKDAGHNSLNENNESLTLEQKKQKLDKALTEAVSVASQFSDKSVSDKFIKKILEPSLNIIKEKYQLQLLEVVQEKERWALHGKINPEQVKIMPLVVVSDKVPQERYLPKSFFKDSKIRVSLYIQHSNFGQISTTMRLGGAKIIEKIVTALQTPNGIIPDVSGDIDNPANGLSSNQIRSFAATIKKWINKPLTKQNKQEIWDILDITEIIPRRTKGKLSSQDAGNPSQYDADHSRAIAWHWFDEGYQQSDKERIAFAEGGSGFKGLKLMNYKRNRAKGAENEEGVRAKYNQRPYVNTKFSSTANESPQNSLMINGVSFTKKNGKALTDVDANGNLL